MTTKGPRQIRAKLERFLRSYPYLVEAISAAALGIICASIALGITFLVSDLTVAIAFSIVAAIFGAIIGWIIADLILFLSFVVLIAIFPEKWWILVLSVCLAIAFTVFHLLANVFVVHHAVLYFAGGYVVTVVLLHLALSLWRFIFRLVGHKNNNGDPQGT